MSWDKALPNFTRRELACPKTGIILLDMNFAVAYPYLRHQWGDALYPNSVCRSPEHNEAIDGHPRSLHLIDNPVHPTDGAMAADNQWRNWRSARKLRFAQLAWRLGWSLGLHDGFIHIDRRVDVGLPQKVFTYNEWASPFTEKEIRQ